MELIFASNNQHKLHELRAALPAGIVIKGLQEAGIEIEIPEPFDTLEENAKEKACTIYRLTKHHCFSEDTGLEVAALGGAPGVHSARYAGDARSFEKNTEKLLNDLSGAADRKAQFRAVICLIWNGEAYFFEGVCPGTITDTPKGEKGFGYDPVFIPEGASKTFAEMSTEEKNRYNHRRIAADKLVAFLKHNHIHL